MVGICGNDTELCCTLSSLRRGDLWRPIMTLVLIKLNKIRFDIDNTASTGGENNSRVLIGSEETVEGVKLFFTEVIWRRGKFTGMMHERENGISTSDGN